jgi:hypothetical protein
MERSVTETLVPNIERRRCCKCGHSGIDVSLLNGKPECINLPDCWKRMDWDYKLLQQHPSVKKPFSLNFLSSLFAPLTKLISLLYIVSRNAILYIVEITHDKVEF